MQDTNLKGIHTLNELMMYYNVIAPKQKKTTTAVPKCVLLETTVYNIVITQILQSVVDKLSITSVIFLIYSAGE